MDLYIYVDESGIIPKPETQDPNYNNFIMSVIITTERDKLKRHFRKGVLKLTKSNKEHAQEMQINSEIKGSHLSESEKVVIFEKVFSNCKDYTEIGIIQLHNFSADDKFKLVPARSFNYLLWKFLIKYYFKHKRIVDKPIDNIHLYIDERNVAQKAKYDLKNYLEMKNFELPEPLFKNISVEYVDSTTNSLVQFSDMVANSYYRWLKFGKSGTEPTTISMINSFLVNGTVFEYPKQYE